MITIKGGSWYCEDMHMDRENDQEVRLWNEGSIQWKSKLAK